MAPAEHTLPLQLAVFQVVAWFLFSFLFPLFSHSKHRSSSASLPRGSEHGSLEHLLSYSESLCLAQERSNSSCLIMEETEAFQDLDPRIQRWRTAFQSILALRLLCHDPTNETLPAVEDSLARSAEGLLAIVFALELAAVRNVAVGARAPPKTCRRPFD